MRGVFAMTCCSWLEYGVSTSGYRLEQLTPCRL